MRILIFGINYAPELTGIGKYTGEMGAWLAKSGHEVEVITALPYYPEWSVHRAYNRFRWVRENIEGATVNRVPLYVPRNVTALKRILHEFSFLAGSLPYWFRALLRKKTDVVISIAPAFHLGLMGVLYSRMTGVPLVYHVQDLQIDMARELGMIRNESFLKVLEKTEQYILRHATLVSTISPGMLGKIIGKGVPAQKTLLFKNWTDTGHIRPLPVEASLRAEWGIGLHDKVVLYAGNLGEKQGLENILAVADRLRHRSDVWFVMVGSGGSKQKLMQLAADRNLRQVLFYPLQPAEKLPALLAAADLHLVIQKKEAADLVLPSKLTGILAAGGCAVVTALPGTSLYELMTDNALGLVVAPESVEALQAGIEQGLVGPLQHYRHNARRYAEQHLSKAAVLSAFETSVKKLVAAHARR